MCSTYLDRLAEEVNDKLQEAGLISIAELCKNYDLPGDFLSEVSQPVLRNPSIELYLIAVSASESSRLSVMTSASLIFTD